MSPEDHQTIRKAAVAFREPVELRLGVAADDRTERLEAFLKALTAAAGSIRYRREDLPEGAPPAIRVPGGVDFMAVPTGRKLEPFLSLLALTAADGLADDAMVKPHLERIQAISAPCLLRLHIAARCPHCPNVLTQWTRIAAAGRHLRLSVVETDLFPELSRTDGVRSVPTLVLDDAIRWVGAARPEDVLPVLADQDPARLDASALENLIRDGQAGDLAWTMQKRQQLFPALVDLLTHPKWPVRLGAMVVVETLAEADPALAARTVDPLVGAFDRLDDQTRGDVLYILGETGSESLLPFIRKAAAEAGSDDLRSAAEEAILRIRDRAASAEAPT